MSKKNGFSACGGVLMCGADFIYLQTLFIYRLYLFADFIYLQTLFFSIPIKRGLDT